MKKFLALILSVAMIFALVACGSKEDIVKARPSTLKGQYLKSVVITPTMGPGVKINPMKLA